MSNNSLKKIALGLVILVVNLLIVFLVSIQSDGNITFEYNVNSSKKDIYQLFYTHDGNFGTYVIDEKYDNIGVEKTLSYMIPREATRLRLDLGESSAEVTISNVKVTYYDQSLDVRSLIDKDPGSMNDISSIKFLDNKIEVVSGGKDPFLTLNLNNIHYPLMKKVDNLKAIPIKIIMCLIVNLLAIMSIIKGSEIKVLFKELYNNRRLVLNLSKNDFKTKYAGSYLGITWAFVQPIVIVLIYWFVFQVGFKSAPMEDFPFLLFLIAGIVPWFFFNDALLNATNCFLEYSYLVKKVVFKISVLPVVKVISAFYVHLFFIILANIIYIIYGYMPSIYMIQTIYYSFCTFILVLGISYMTSSIVIFFKDLGQIVSILLQFSMWMTPIMYSYEMIPHDLQWVIKINPMYYIVEGYRDAFIRHIWFWEKINETIYFWCLAAFVFLMGVVIFKKLKLHFADVL